VAARPHPAPHAGRDQRLQRAEDGGATEAAVPPAELNVHLLRGELPAARLERVGHQQALAGDALTRLVEALGDRRGAQCAPTTPAKAERR
jgi:hypothetical protein